MTKKEPGACGKYRTSCVCTTRGGQVETGRQPGSIIFTGWEVSGSIRYGVALRSASLSLLIGIPVTERSPVAVVLLSFVTFGIYFIFWLATTRGEVKALGADVPTTWLFIVPFVSVWWIWKFSEGTAQVSNGSAAVNFILLFLVGPIGAAVIQSELNTSTARPGLQGYGAPSYGAPTGYGAPAGYGAPNGAPTGYGAPSGQGIPSVYGTPPDHGTPSN